MDFDHDEVRRLLLATQSVQETAGLLGVDPRQVSRFLRQNTTRRIWWQNLKDQWSRERRALRQARSRLGRVPASWLRPAADYDLPPRVGRPPRWIVVRPGQPEPPRKPKPG